MKKQLILLATVGATLVAGPALASTLAVQATFSDRQREMIVSYSNRQTVATVESHDGNGGKGHKGKSKEKGLPPGIAMNLERGKPLPPGIAKTRLPNDLLVTLPPPPKGHEIVVIGGHVVLVETRTQTVRDRLDVYIRP